MRSGMASITVMSPEHMFLEEVSPERTYSSIMGNYKYRTCFSCATISSL